MSQGSSKLDQSNSHLSSHTSLTVTHLAKYSIHGRSTKNAAKCALLCFGILCKYSKKSVPKQSNTHYPILGNLTVSGFSVVSTDLREPGVPGSSPSTLTTSLAIPDPSSSSSNGPSN